MRTYTWNKEIDDAETVNSVDGIGGSGRDAATIEHGVPEAAAGEGANRCIAEEAAQSDIPTHCDRVRHEV